jgi:hypothetical protein
VSYNGAGLFLINTAGQPVVGNTLIDSSVFNAFTADIATGLTTCITKDGQTTPTANIPMGGFKITGLGLGTATTDAASLQNLINANVRKVCDFRLTLTTGVPVTTADVTAVTNLYFSPYGGGNQIALYNGTNWIIYSSAEMSITNSGVGGAVPSDVFCFANAGVPTLEFSQWTNDTTRATALTTQDGVLVKTGSTIRRYVGTIRATGGGAFSDSYATRWVWNYYNRVVRPMRSATESADSWTYATATYRQANANTANQLDFVIGWAEDALMAIVQAAGANNGAAPVAVPVSIGLDSTTTPATGCLMCPGLTQVTNFYVPTTAQLTTIPAVGRHFLAWLEIGSTGTTTFLGDAGSATTIQSGIHGWIRA